MIQVGLEQVWGTVLSRSQACSGPDQGRLWTWTGNVLSMIKECFELEWGMFWAWMGMEWSRVGEGLSQDWNRTRTEPGPVPDRPGTDGDYRDAQSSWFTCDDFISKSNYAFNFNKIIVLFNFLTMSNVMDHTSFAVQPYGSTDGL